jgi:hypothetical protein
MPKLMLHCAAAIAEASTVYSTAAYKGAGADRADISVKVYIYDEQLLSLRTIGHGKGSQKCS